MNYSLTNVKTIIHAFCIYSVIGKCDTCFEVEVLLLRGSKYNMEAATICILGKAALSNFVIIFIAQQLTSHEQSPAVSAAPDSDRDLIHITHVQLKLSFNKLTLRALTCPLLLRS